MMFMADAFICEKHGYTKIKGYSKLALDFFLISWLPR
jgi:hypothetical protein